MPAVCHGALTMVPITALCRLLAPAVGGRGGWDWDERVEEEGGVGGPEHLPWAGQAGAAAPQIAPVRSGGISFGSYRTGSPLGTADIREGSFSRALSWALSGH